MKKIQMVDLKSQYQSIKEEVKVSMDEVLESTAFINGPKVHEFQKNLENYLIDRIDRLDRPIAGRRVDRAIARVNRPTAAVGSKARTFWKQSVAIYYWIPY